MEARAREFDFNDDNFDFLRKLANTQIGINLSDAKRELVYSRVSRRIRQLGLADFDDYCRVVGKDDQELVRFVNAVTTNLTYFFREPHHFEYLAREVSPMLAERHAHDRRVRLWSAACSTGEEAYSIAMALRESAAFGPRYDVKLLATDVDSDVLARAERGVYPVEAKGLDKQRLRRWFKTNGDQIQIRPEVKALITFRQLNLMDCWPMKGPFDVIVCRNVVIYFTKETQRVLFDRMADLLTPDGLLFLGHSESLFAVSERFKLLGRTVYQKIA